PKLCSNHQLTPRMDSSNLSTSPLRNRIRHQLLPLLKSYNPGITEILLRTARIALDELDFLDKEGARLWDRLVQRQGDIIILDKENFLQLPPALMRHLLRMAIEELLGNLRNIEACHIEEIMAILAKPAGKRLNLPAGLVFSIEYNRYLLGQDPAALSPFPTLSNKLPIKVPGETLLPGWRVTAAILNQEEISGKQINDNLFTAYLDFDKTGDELILRSRYPGDQFMPLGMNQPKKLSEFMINAKAPHAWRKRIPIVSSREHILWVVGWRIDDRVKVSENTKRILYLKFES
ncbi:tRNA lysidine(34) synthetase TilS, partial [Chloroflexota bacterium]